MTTNEKTILDLAAAMERAQAQGRPDSDAKEANIISAQRMAHEIRTICEKYHDRNNGPLSAHLIARTLSILLGTIIQTNANNDLATTAALTGELCILIFEVACKELSP